jgi:hypothetical protein
MPKEIQDISKYLKDLVESGQAIPVEAAKFSRIEARQGEIGEMVQTVLADGTVETERPVEADEKTGKPGWVVKNVNTPEQWIISDSTFTKKYEIDPENPAQYKPKGGPMIAVQVQEDLTFQPPNWGGYTQTLNADGFLLMDPNNPIDIYGIGKDEFDQTYALTEKSASLSLVETLKLIGSEKEATEVMKAALDFDIEKFAAENTALDDLDVYPIAKDAFDDAKNLSEIEIPDDVKSIDPNSFDEH